MTSDGPIVDEVRQRREQISDRFGNDIDRYGEHIRELQEKYRARLVSQIKVVPASSEPQIPRKAM